MILACLSRSSKRSSRIRSSGTWTGFSAPTAPNSTAATPSSRRRCRSSQIRTQAYLCAADSPSSPPLVVAQTVRSRCVENLRARRGLHHRPQRTSSSERQAEEYPGHTAACSATVCNECGDSCDIRVVTPDLGDAEDEPSLSAGESTQTASTAGRARRLCYPSSWRAAPCGPVSIVFQEKKSSCDVPVPSGP